MARSTGPILAVGAITMANRTLLHGKPVDWRIPVATVAAAGVLSLVERVSPTLAVGIAWISLATILLARVDPKVPSPTESALEFMKQSGLG